MYLLDTNVISELRKNKTHGGVVTWIASIADEEIFLAARARVHRLTVVTRNVRDFKTFEVPVFGPFRGK